MDFYHYRMVVYRHCQHTSQYNQLVKVDIALYVQKCAENQYVWKLLVVRYENNTSHSIITYCEAHIRNNESKHRWAGWACGNGSCVDKKAAHAFLASSLRGLTFSQLFMSQRLLSQTHTWETTPHGSSGCSGTHPPSLSSRCVWFRWG